MPNHSFTSFLTAAVKLTRLNKIFKISNLLYNKKELNKETYMNIYKYLGKEFKCEYCGNTHKINIKFIEKGKVEEIPEILKKYLPQENKILILADNITYEVAGKKIENILKEGGSVKSVILNPEGEKKVTAQEKYLAKIEKKLSDEKIIITAGTGTITDLGKIIGDKFNIPVICFPTAASMNAYTSPVAAYIKEGVKFTISVKSAEGIFMDFDTIKNAPSELTKSGFADSLAKSFANTDWKISSIITGEYFCLLPYKIVSAVEKKYINNGKLIKKRDKKTIEYLMEGLNLGGISMAIAGKSSPASGGEHLISHFLDMYAHQNSREVFNFHGIQVASGIFISSLLYEEIKNLELKQIKEMINKRNIDYSEKFEKLISYFPSGKEILRKEFENKMKNLKFVREKLSEKWEEIKKNVLQMTIPSKKIKKIFEEVDIPFYLKDIGVDEKLAFDNITLARFIRNRITILDIADEIGILESFAKRYIKGDLK